MYYVYILRCKDNSLYTGITTDVQRRFFEHKENKIKGAKYTKSHKPVGIEAVWETDTKSDASKLEYRIKKLSKTEKETVISEHINLDEVISLPDELKLKRIEL